MERQFGYFLTQAWNFMVQHEPNFPDDEARVSYITLALEGEATNWVVYLHDAITEELHDFDYFMIALRQPFKDPLADWMVKSSIKVISNAVD